MNREQSEMLSEIDGKLLNKLLYFWKQYFEQTRGKQTDLVPVILFLSELRYFSNSVKQLDNVFKSANSIFENTDDYYIYQMLVNEDMNKFDKPKLNLGVKKVVRMSNNLKIGLEKFNKILNIQDTEEMLFVNLDSNDHQSRFLDKFYLIELNEHDGIITHNTVNFDLIADSAVKKVLILPKNLNDHKVVCVYESKFNPINNRMLSDIEFPESKEFSEEFVTTSIIHSIAKYNSFRLYSKNITDNNIPCRLLSICKIVSNWKYVSCIKNLPGHIYGTMECINQIKQKYQNNDKSELRYFSQKFEEFSRSQTYNEFIQNDVTMKNLQLFSDRADEILVQYYAYDIKPNEIFKQLCIIGEEYLIGDLQDIHNYLQYLASEEYTIKYTDFAINSSLLSLISMVYIKHDLILLHIYSTLDDVEKMFMLPYEINHLKYDFKDKLKNALALSLYNFQYTLEENSSYSGDIATLTSLMKSIEKNLKESLDKLPENYEKQQGKIKQLLLKLKELYADNIDKNQLIELASKIFTGYQTGESINYEQVHQKLRSATNSCIQLFSSFLSGSALNDSLDKITRVEICGNAHSVILVTLLNISNTLFSCIIALERKNMPLMSLKLHQKVINYPDMLHNPLSMLSLSNSNADLNLKTSNKLIYSLQLQLQNLVKKEVTERQVADQNEIDEINQKGLFKIPVIMQMEQLKKISKSIMDKTQKDIQQEEQEELEDIQRNFPTYHDEFDVDNLQDEEIQDGGQDYIQPKDENTAYFIKDSFSNSAEKKRCFHKLLKVYQSLLIKRDSMIYQRDIMDGQAEIMRVNEIVTLLETSFTRSTLEKVDEVFTISERKIFYLNLKRCFEKLIEESKMKETKITLDVSSKSLPLNYNFYHDPNFAEIKLVYAPIIKVVHRCIVVSEDWGDHPIIFTIMLICNKILRFDCYSTPVAKILSGLEFVLEKLEEYEKIASKKFNSFQDQINSVKLLIVRYRKLQIISWRQMMNSKHDTALVDDFDSFIRLVYALNTEVNTEGTVEYDKIFNAVDLYIRDSNLSQFKNRLLHLHIVKDQMESINKIGASNVIHFVHSYYSMLRPIFEDVMKQLQTETETKIKTIVDVSKWSVQKFRTSRIGSAFRQLNKTLNKYSRDVLDRNITNAVLSKSRLEIISKYKVSANNVRGEIVDILHDPKNIIKKEAHSKLESNNIIKQLRHITKHQIFEKWIDITTLESKNAYIISKIIDEWDKKKSAQRRDLNELFKYLKSQGLSPNYKRVIEANRTSKFIDINDIRFMYSHPSIEISDSMKYVLTRNEFYFYKSFEMLMILGSSFEINEDIKNSEISQMRNLTGSLYYKLLSYSKNLNKMITEIKSSSISDLECRHKHSLILDQFAREAKNSDDSEVGSFINYEVLNFSKSKRIIHTLIKTLEKINFMLLVNVQQELNYYQDICG